MTKFIVQSKQLLKDAKFAGEWRDIHLCRNLVRAEREAEFMKSISHSLDIRICDAQGNVVKNVRINS